MKQLLENQILQRLTSNLPRHPKQLNAFLESDAELIPLNEKMILAVTADTLVEEIETGLYQDPFLIGWMSVMANLSDLAAVGAKPIGLVLIQHLPNDLSDEFLEALQSGINKACEATGTFVLGGDTNTSEKLQVGATAVGMLEAGKTIMRRGCGVGDLLFASGPFGAGSAYAFTRLLSSGDGRTFPYQPAARLQEGPLVRKYGSACIDTSDGFLPAIANLIEINGKGFKLSNGVEALMSVEVEELAKQAPIPSWFFLAGPHGEFELLFTIPSKQEDAFLAEAKAMNWKPLKLGQVIDRPHLYFSENNSKRQVDPFRLANLFSESGGQARVYLNKLLQAQFYEKQE